MTKLSPWRSVIEALAAGEAAALRHVAEVEAARDAYQLMVQVLLERAHEQAAVVERLRETIARDRDAHRRLREAILRGERRAA